MGISVDAFVREYKVAAKQKDTALDAFVNKHITTKYVDFIKKNVYCDSIIRTTCHFKDGDREFIRINSPSRYLFFMMRLISLYTDIDIKDEEVVQEYDKLNEVGAVNKLIAAIPDDEYDEFSTILNMKLDDFRDNEYSLTALLYNLKESFSLSEEVIGSVLEELKKQAEQEK